MIRPIDMQMLLPRTESVANTQQHENQSIINSNINAANEAEKDARMNSETVVKKEDSDFESYQYDATEEGNGTYSKPQNKKKKKSEPQEVDSDSVNEEVAGESDHQPRINIQI